MRVGSRPLRSLFTLLFFLLCFCAASSALADDPVNAYWLGTASDTDFSDTAKWDCKDANGDSILDALPGSTTVVHFSGSAVPEIPVGASISCAKVSFDGSATLPADRDLRGLGKSIQIEGTLTLAGHKLTVAGLTTGSGTITSSSSGEVIVEVPSGQTLTLSAVTLSGTLKLVKKGSGTLNISNNNSYSGGTEIQAGKVVLNGNGGSAPLGANNSNVYIRSNGVLDVYGVENTSNKYKFNLDGGTLQSTGRKAKPDQKLFVNVKLTADSTLTTGKNNGTVSPDYGFVAASYGTTTLDLGGHTLTFSIGTGTKFYMCNTTVKNGTVNITNGGWLQTYNNKSITANTADFIVKCAINLSNGAMSVKGYEARYTGDSNNGSYALNVYGTFKPNNSNGYYYGPTMQNGSTIDMTAWPAAKGWPMYSRFSNGNKQMSFANGTVNVKLYMSRADMKTLARTKANGEYAGYLLKWGTGAGQLATKNANTKFVLDSASASQYRLVVDDTGLLLRPDPGLILIVQ